MVSYRTTQDSLFWHHGIECFFQELGGALFFQDPRGEIPSQEPGGAMVQVEDCFFQEPLFRNPVARLVVGNQVDGGVLFQEPDSGFPFSGTRLQFSACSGIRWLTVIFRNHVFRNRKWFLTQRSRLPTNVLD